MINQPGIWAVFWAVLLLVSACQKGHVGRTNAGDPSAAVAAAPIAGVRWVRLDEKGYPRMDLVAAPIWTDPIPVAALKGTALLIPGILDQHPIRALRYSHTLNCGLAN